MKHIKLTVYCLLSAVYCLLLLSGCGEEHEKRLRKFSIIAKIEISPSSSTLIITNNQQFVAVAKDRSGREVNDIKFIWESDNESVVTIDPDTGLANAVSKGKARVKAISSGIFSNSAVITVINPISAIEIFPPSPVINIGTSQPITSIVKDISANQISGIDVTLTSDNPSVAVIDNNGIASGISQGEAAITASVGGVISNQPVILNVSDTVGVSIAPVISSIEVFPSSGSIDVCTDMTFVPIIWDNSNPSKQVSGINVTWSSDNPSVAVIDNNGIASGISQGKAAITASVGGVISNTVIFTVNNPISSIELMPVTVSAPALKIGMQYQFTAIARNSIGNNLSSIKLSWGSSAPQIASVDQNGLVTGISGGIAHITASCGGIDSNIGQINVLRIVPNLLWKQTTQLPRGRYDHTASVNGGFLYIIGGVSFGGFQNSVHFAQINNNGTLGAWNLAAELPLEKAIRGHTTVVGNNSLYVMGGIESGIPEQSLTTIFSEVVVATSDIGIPIDIWKTNLNPLPIGLFAHGAVFAKNYIYVIGGWEGTLNSDAVFFAPILNNSLIGKWNETTPLPKGLSKHIALTNGEYIYVIGGSTGGIEDVEIAQTNSYFTKINNDGTLNGWQTTTPLPIGIEDHSAVMVGGYIFVIGGWNGWDPMTIENRVFFSPINYIDGSLGIWQEASPIPEALYSHAAVVNGDIIYVTGGIRGTEGKADERKRTVYYTRLQN
ncbi:MAG: Ig-like domain-containing protein [Nitrospirota bacterium]